ncbi:unnamed protein product [Cuscuta epithymum]|uniref:Protein FAR1-RELATED SEQUENCE n=2 Tax=Cuscuta epithymum TaxID=186058 RepID=A0AAV0FEB1_9ASTE|nr:unnamed protein product [Cuscuta epithymum]
MKTMWASAYMRDKFFASIRTTSICEVINSFIKRYVQNKNNLVDFMHNFERAVKEYRHNELISDFKSLYTDPLLTSPLHVYESWASQVFTRNKFWEVRKQIENVARLNLVERVEHGGDNTCFRMNKFGSTDTEFLVMYDKGGCNFVCDCRFYESRGIPCAHIFCAMRHENIDSVPSSLICQRWTKKAKLDSMSSINGNGDDSELSNLDMLRSGAISAACNRLYRAACKKPSLYSEFIVDIQSLIGKFEKRGGDALNLNNGSKVLDPTIVKTKGAPRKERNTRKRRRCGHCQRHGHTKRKCPTLINRDQLHVLEEEEVEGNDESSEQSDDTGTTNNGNAHMLGSKGNKNKKKRKNTEDPARCANTNDDADRGNNSHINLPVTNANDELANGIMLAQDRHHQGGHIQMPGYNNIPTHHTNYNGYMTSNWQFYPQYPAQPAAMFHAQTYGGLHQGYPYHGYHNSFVSTLKEVERNAKDGIKNGKGG